MGSISGIEKQVELESLPFFNKQTAGVLIGKKGKNLDKKISQLLRKDYFWALKKGLYISERYYLLQPDKKSFIERLANILCSPSYLSLEYVLSLFGLIPEGVNIFTSISLKSSRIFNSKIGTFVYKNIKSDLFCGYDKVSKGGEYSVYIATKPKSLFDFLYLKRNLSDNLSYELREGLRINWEPFSLKDIKEFEKYVVFSKSVKMRKVLDEIKRIKNAD